jgi:V/A-type H+-transporting ATPase subunit D
MPVLPGVPPGRAGHNWLRRRQAIAERGLEQLDRKLRILHPERQRLELRADRARADWRAACAEARTWLLRAALLGGQDGIRTARPDQEVGVTVRWTTSMGLSYPVEATLVTTGPTADQPRGNAAIVPATEAFRAAAMAGSRLAAAEEAVRRMDAEIAVTRRRLRALEKRWLPRLEESLAALELTLEQAELEEGMRLRQAAGVGSGRRWVP